MACRDLDLRLVTHHTVGACVKHAHRRTAPHSWACSFESLKSSLARYLLPRYQIPAATKPPTSASPNISRQPNNSATLLFDQTTQCCQHYAQAILATVVAANWLEKIVIVVLVGRHLPVGGRACQAGPATWRHCKPSYCLLKQWLAIFTVLLGAVAGRRD